MYPSTIIYHVHPRPPVVKKAMNSSAFNNLISSATASNFDSDKVDTIKTGIKAAGIVSPEQVAQLLHLINFSGGQLEVAKMAFHHVHESDRGSYVGAVGAVFSYSSDKTKLNDYIRQH